MSDAAFREAWLGDHVSYARNLPGLREYVIDFVAEAPEGMPSGIATVRFDTREALEAAFQTPGLRDDLIRTRDDFADAVQILFVDECIVVPAHKGTAR